MKRNFIDRLVGIFSPQAEARRMKARLSLDMYHRTYDAAQTFKTDDWTSVSSASPNKEIAGAIPTLREKARDAVRNNPYALHAKDVIIGNTVGYGIVPNIKGPDETTVKQVRDAWAFWAETTRCDAEGKRNFYGMQAAVLGSIVEAGEVLVEKRITQAEKIYTLPSGKQKDIPGITKLSVLESDFIDSSKDENGVVQGIEIDSNGKPSAYWLFDAHPGDGKTVVSKKFDAKNIIHLFKADRVGQRRGVSWFHAVIRILEDLKNYQEAMLIRQKIAACFSILITPGDTDSLNASQVAQQRQLDSMVEPGLIRYGNPGEKIEFASPPGVDGYDAYCRQNLRAVAAGLNITYEALSNDYSQSNYSSSRLGSMQMNKSIDQWRWNMIIPGFCEPTFNWFLEWCEISLGIKTQGVTADWTPPAREFIDPITEIEAIKRAIRIGVKTQDDAIREQGQDPETFYKEVAAANKKMDELGLAFDSDARKMSSVGQGQSSDIYNILNGKEPIGEEKSEDNTEEEPS